jgi:hypothetical protein
MQRSRILDDHGPERLYEMHMKRMQELEKVVL